MGKIYNYIKPIISNPLLSICVLVAAVVVLALGLVVGILAAAVAATCVAPIAALVLAELFLKPIQKMLYAPFSFLSPQAQAPFSAGFWMNPFITGLERLYFFCRKQHCALQPVLIPVRIAIASVIITLTLLKHILQATVIEKLLAIIGHRSVLLRTQTRDTYLNNELTHWQKVRTYNHVPWAAKKEFTTGPDTLLVHCEGNCRTFENAKLHRAKWNHNELFIDYGALLHEGMRFTDVIKKVAALIQQEGSGKKVVIRSHSMGGYVARRAVASIIKQEQEQEPLKRSSIYLLSYGTPKSLIPIIGKHFPEIRHTLTCLFRFVHGAEIDQDPEATLRTANQLTVTAMHGKQDEIVPRELAIYDRDELIDGATHNEIPKSYETWVKCALTC